MAVTSGMAGAGARVAGEVGELVRRRGARPVRGRSGRPGVRLTPRGRMVLGFLALLIAGLGLVLAAPPSQAADPAGVPRTVVVQPGDTLWSIASRYVPDGDRFAAIDDIRRLNGLSGYTIEAGEKLTLPSRR